MPTQKHKKAHEEVMKQQIVGHGWSPGLLREKTRGREGEDNEWQLLQEFGDFFSVDMSSH